jgi:hypothetical protein
MEGLAVAEEGETTARPGVSVRVFATSSWSAHVRAKRRGRQLLGTPDG